MATFQETNNLAGKHVVISGASRGLGLELSRMFVSKGACVLACARSSTRLNELAEEFKGSSALFKACDVRNEQSVHSLIKHAIETYGPIDVLISNAAVHGALGSIEQVELKDWTSAIETNLYGALNLVRAALPHMKMRKAGKIIQISGGGATAPMARMSAYATSKAALVRMMECLAEDLREFGIDVNCVAPGILPTRLVEEVLESGAATIGADYHARLSREKPDSSSAFSAALDLICFLASQESDGITGKLISAHWDNWQDFSAYKEQLIKSDLLTLRRISGRDRGAVWCDRSYKRG